MYGKRTLLQHVTRATLVMMATRSACAMPSPKTSDPTNSTSVSTLNWQDCSTSSTPGLQCAQLEVPVDHNDPQGPKITLGMNRVQALDTENRIGSVFWNPGGPGGQASAQIKAEASGRPFFSKGARNYFDIISLDPRGVGLSAHVRCDPNIWNKRVSHYPQDEASFKKMVEYNTELGESCLNLTGPLLYHVDTASVAHDLEAIRLALGEGKLNYLGGSYGTQIGSQYAALYPKNIRAMMLDGNFDHSLSDTALHMFEIWSLEDQLIRFASWCNDTPSCALHDTNILSLIDELLTQADEKPLPAPGCQETGACRSDVSVEEFLATLRTGLLQKEAFPLLGRSGFAGLATALVEAKSGNATFFSAGLAQSEDSPLFPAWAIECLDWNRNVTSFADLKNKMEFGRLIAPHTRGISSASYFGEAYCSGWPAPVANPPQVFGSAITDAPPILLVNAKHDSASGYPHAQSLLEHIPGSVLLTRDGDGHGSYGFFEVFNEYVDKYLVTGELPEPNTVVKVG